MVRLSRKYFGKKTQKVVEKKARNRFEARLRFRPKGEQLLGKTLKRLAKYSTYALAEN